MKLFVTLIICSLFMGPFPPALAGDGNIDLTVEGEFLSARLKGVPLTTILEKLERERGIWFRGDSSLLEEAISVQFTDLPFAEGLGRILNSMNYSLVFDGNDRLAGVIVIGESVADGADSKSRAGVQRRTISPSERDEQADMDRTFAGMGNSPPAATGESRRNSGVIGNYPQPEEEPGKFTVVRDSPPPVSPGEIATGIRDDFTVVTNCPPPDGPSQGTGESPDGFTVTENCPPPGDPAEVGTQQLEKFNVVENCPPPGS